MYSQFFNEKDDFLDNESVTSNAEEEAFIDETVNFLNYPNKQLSLEEELANSISTDIATDLFEKSVRVESKSVSFETKSVSVESKSVSFETKSVSLNDKLQNSAIQVGLNDRIAFVKYLFNGS